MPITIKVLDPVDQEEVKYEVTWTDDLALAEKYLDKIEPDAPRHAIAFFKAGSGDGSKTLSELVGIGFKHDANATVSASFTALAVNGTLVEAKDRKYIKGAKITEH